MSLQTVTFDVSEDALATLDEIAANLEADRATVLREAVALYLADYEDLKAELAESIRQADAGETSSHEEVMQRLETSMAAARAVEAA